VAWAIFTLLYNSTQHIRCHSYVWHDSFIYLTWSTYFVAPIIFTQNVWYCICCISITCHWWCLCHHSVFQSSHTATHCNTLKHTATHCKTLQHTATHCNTLQHTAKHCDTMHRSSEISNPTGFQRTDPTILCNTLHRTATHRKTPHRSTEIKDPTTRSHNTLQHNTTHCNTLHCSTEISNPTGFQRLDPTIRVLDYVLKK